MNAPGPAAATGSSTKVLAIASANTWVHVFPDHQRLIDCQDINLAQPGPLDYFDLSGRRLAPVLNSAGKLVGLRLTSDPADVVMVRARLSAVVKHVRDEIAQRLAEMEDPPGTEQEAMAQLPDLEGLSLSVCYDRLAAPFGDGNGLPETPGSFWHRFWCH